MAADNNASGALTAQKMEMLIQQMQREESRKISSHLSDAITYGISARKLGGDSFNYAGGAGGGGASGVAMPSKVAMNPNAMQAMICSRMRWPGIGMGPFSTVECRELGEQIVVFLVFGEKAVLVYDDVALFPSDALVTQLRLLAD